MRSPVRVGTTEGWVRALAHAAPARIQWDRVALTAVGITAPVALAVGVSSQHPHAVGLGALAAMGALAASIMDVGTAGAQRVRRVSLVAFVASLGFALGTWVHGQAIWTLFAVVGATLVSAIAGTVSRTASKTGLYFLVFVVTAANADFGLQDPWQAPMVFFAGAVGRLVLTVVAAGMMGAQLSPERKAVAEVYSAIARQLESIGTAQQDAASARVTDALNNAYDVLVAARTGVAARDRHWRNLVTMLNASSPVVDAAVAMATRGHRPDASSLAYLDDISRWLLQPQGELPEPPASHARGAEGATLAAGLSYLARVAGRIDSTRRPPVTADDLALPAKPSTRVLMSQVRRSIIAGGETWFPVLRLVLTMAVAQSVSLLLHLEQPYLVMLTVAQTMKPDLGSVFARAVQRSAGTLLGVVVALGALAVVPVGWWHVVAIFLLAGLIPIAMPRNYGLYSGVSICLAVMLVDLHGGAGFHVLLPRLLDTVLGSAIVLLIGYLPWPSTWRAPRQIGLQIAELIRALVDYLDVALGETGRAGGPAQASAPDVAVGDESRARADARRGVYRQISDLRMRITQSALEPPRVSAATVAWSPEIAALERVADAITAAAATTWAPGPDTAGAQPDVARVRAALVDLADSIGAQRRPAVGELPTSGPLSDLADEVMNAQGAVASYVQGSIPSHHFRLKRH